MRDVSTWSSLVSDDLKIGDLLYRVGHAHNPPHNLMDLCVYSARIKNIRQGETATAFELSDDRPVLGFAQWLYMSYEIGVKVHRSATDALRAFAVLAFARMSEADR